MVPDISARAPGGKAGVGELLKIQGALTLSSHGLSLPTMPANTKCWSLDEIMATAEAMSIRKGTRDISMWVMTFGYVCFLPAVG